MGVSRPLALVVAALISGCDRSAPPPAVAPRWAVSEGPMVSIADSTVPRGHEFNGISSARRLEDHGLLVANAGAAELELFDSAGRFQRAIGRKGRGPGDFETMISVFAWRADSIAVYDAGNVRWTILDPALAVTRMSAAPDPRILQPTWLYHGAMVNDGVTDSVPGWVFAVVDSVRKADPQFTRLIRGRRDDVGALWLRDSLDDRRWTVYLAAGKPAATVVLPSNLEPLQIGRDFIVGLIKDSLGVEQIRVHSLRRGDTPVASAGFEAAFPTPDSAMLGSFRFLLVAQEGYYSNRGRYATRADSLELSPPFPYRLFLLEADSRHWTGIAIRVETGATCGLSIGWPAPVGWMDGTIFCGR